MNGSRVYKRVSKYGTTLFVKLPMALRRPCDGCFCEYCRNHPELEPMWDTLAMSPDSNHAWTVHYPELVG